MPQISAWQCPRTGQLFATHAEYLEYLKHAAACDLLWRKENKRRLNKAAFFTNMRESVKSVDEICQFVKDNFQAFVDNGADHDSFGHKQKPVECLDFTLKMRDMTIVSNSHTKPLDGVTNFCRTADKPKGYPGIEGRMNLRHKGEFRSFTSNIFTNTGICLGGGGGGSSSYQSEVRLYAQDWAFMREEGRYYQENLVMAKLSTPW